MPLGEIDVLEHRYVMEAEAMGKRLGVQDWQEGVMKQAFERPWYIDDHDNVKKQCAWNEVVRTFQDCQKANYDIEDTAEVLYDLISKLISELPYNG
jgi:hypothetical protein